MSTLGFYFAGLTQEEANEVRARLNTIAASFGFIAQGGPTKGEGNAAALLVAIANGILIVKRQEDRETAMVAGRTAPQKETVTQAGQAVLQSEVPPSSTLVSDIFSKIFKRHRDKETVALEDQSATRSGDPQNPTLVSDTFNKIQNRPIPEPLEPPIEDLLRYCRKPGNRLGVGLLLAPTLLSHIPPNPDAVAPALGEAMEVLLRTELERLLGAPMDHEMAALQHMRARGHESPTLMTLSLIWAFYIERRDVRQLENELGLSRRQVYERIAQARSEVAQLVRRSVYK